jgi:putative spermidine/putrescine transport system permease protein
MTYFKKSMVATALLLSVIPFLLLLMLSLAQGWMYPQVLPGAYSTGRWGAMLHGTNGLAASLFLSLTIAFTTATIATIAGILISRAIASHKHKQWLLFACYFPLALSPVIYSLLLNHFFIQANLTGTAIGVVLAQLLVAIPLCILLLSSCWSRQLQALEQTGATLGSSPAQVFFKIVLPVVRPQLTICFIQAFLISWFEYGLTTIIGVGKVQTITVKVYQYIAEANVFDAALACCIIVLPLAFLLWINKRFVYSKTI